MNSLFKITALVILCLPLLNCSRIVKEESYLKAESTKPLEPLDGKDLPRTTNALKVPEIQTEINNISPDSMPPEMSFAKRRSSDENVVIIESGGMPTIEIFNDKDAWELMLGDLGYNWQLLDDDEENCQATFRFYDPIIEEVDQGFFKKLFQINNSYVDRSGEYVLTCLKLPQKQQIWLQTVNFEAPSAYVVDDLFNHLFDAAIETED